MTFRPAVDTDRDAWQALIGGQASGDFLHDWAWDAVAAFDGQPQRRFLVEEDGQPVVVAAAQVRQIGLRRSFWYVPHGPVTDYAHPAAGGRLRALMEGLASEARADHAVAIRLEPRLEHTAPEVGLLDALAHRVPQDLQVGQTRIVDLLEDDDALMSGFDADTRNAVRRASREGIEVSQVTDASDRGAVDRLYGLVEETQRRAGFRLPPRERYGTAWQALAATGRACLLEARREGDLLASGMVVVEGSQSFYLFAGSRREAAGEPKRFASYGTQWAMMREARARGARRHDLWGIAPAGAGPEHPWYGVGLFKRGFGGRVVKWAGSWEIVIDPLAYRVRAAASRLRRRTPRDVP